MAEERGISNRLGDSRPLDMYILVDTVRTYISLIMLTASYHGEAGPAPAPNAKPWSLSAVPRLIGMAVWRARSRASTTHTVISGQNMPNRQLLQVAGMYAVSRPLGLARCHPWPEMRTPASLEPSEKLSSRIISTPQHAAMARRHIWVCLISASSLAGSAQLFLPIMPRSPFVLQPSHPAFPSRSKRPLARKDVWIGQASHERGR